MGNSMVDFVLCSFQNLLRSSFLASTLVVAGHGVGFAGDTSCRSVNDCVVVGAEVDDADSANARLVPGSGPEIGVVSDLRVTSNMKPVGRLPNGLQIYSFQFAWEERVRVGLIAQELAERADTRDAVLTMSNGLLGIDYTRLKMRVATEAEWLAHGLDALQIDYFSPEALAAEELPVLHNRQRAAR